MNLDGRRLAAESLLFLTTDLAAQSCATSRLKHGFREARCSSLPRHSSGLSLPEQSCVPSSLLPSS